MAIVILDTSSIRGDVERIWPLGSKELITPGELVSIVIASWIEGNSLCSCEQNSTILINNLTDHFGDAVMSNWHQLAQSIYLIVDQYMATVCNLANVTDVVYAGHVRDGIKIKLHGENVLNGTANVTPRHFTHCATN